MRRKIRWDFIIGDSIFLILIGTTFSLLHYATDSILSRTLFVMGFGLLAFPLAWIQGFYVSIWERPLVRFYVIQWIGVNLLAFAFTHHLACGRAFLYIGISIFAFVVHQGATFLEQLKQHCDSLLDPDKESLTSDSSIVDTKKLMK